VIFPLKFIEFEGKDHLFWVGNTAEVLAEIKSFIMETRSTKKPVAGLETVLSAKINPSNKSISRYDMICHLARQHNGKIKHYNDQGFSVIFKGPGKAVNCALELTEKIQSLRQKVSSCIHMHEGTINNDGSSPDKCNSIAERILSQSYPGQILITQTIKHLLSGVALNLTKHNTIFDSLTIDSCTLYQVSIDNNSTLAKSFETKLPPPITFLERVLQSIKKHLDNESFGVEILSRETGVSERQLQRKIKGMTNKSPNQLINSVRLNKAKELLMLQKFTVAEIAFKTGFSSPSYFSKCFKKEFGISPTSLL